MRRLFAAVAFVLAMRAGATAVFTGTTTGQPIAAGPSCSCGPPSTPEAHISWTATAGGTATATTCPETAYDSILAVSDSTGREVACSDDTDSSRDCSTVSWPVTAGSTWTLAVTGCRGSAGPYTLHVDGPTTSTGPACWPTATWGKGTAACSAANLSALCLCAESMTWGAVPDVDRYEIFERVPGGPWKQVGTNRGSPAWTDEDGPHPPTPPLTTWIFAKGDVHPAGTLMEYGVRACKLLLCSAGMPSVTSYRWSPYLVLP